MPQKILEAARDHFPLLLEEGVTRFAIPSGKKLMDLADSLTLGVSPPGKLSIAQVQIQKLIGCLKFIERLHPRISLILHRLSCVMSNPPLAALDVARAALKAAYDERDVGITYGGVGLRSEARLGGRIAAHVDLSEPAPALLEGMADATWGDRNLYAILLTFGGGAVFHTVKKISLIVDSSMETEAVASCKGAESIAYAREILRALGVPDPEPTLLGTDNLANQKVASGIGSPARSKHFLRRYGALKRRISEGEVAVKYVPDSDMPADFLTKWLPRPKVEMSVAYATNSRFRVGSAPI
jgi:hypothetical protein